MQISNTNFLKKNFQLFQHQSNDVNFVVYAVPNAFYVLSGVNISAERIFKDQLRPHLLIYLKSGHFNEFLLSKPEKKISTLSIKND